MPASCRTKSRSRGSLDPPTRVESRVTVSSCGPARATTSTCAVIASRKPLHPSAAAKTVTAVQARTTAVRGIGDWMRETAERNTRGPGSDISSDISGVPERRDQPADDVRPTQADQLEGQRLRAANFDLELDVVERGRQALHPRHGVGAKGNTG